MIKGRRRALYCFPDRLLEGRRAAPTWFVTIACANVGPLTSSWAARIIPRPEGGRRVLHQRDAIAELHREPPCGLHARIRDEADEDDPLDPVLLELLVEVGVREAVLRPVLLDDDIALSRREARRHSPPHEPFAKTCSLTDESWYGVGCFTWSNPVGSALWWGTTNTRMPAPRRGGDDLAEVVEDGVLDAVFQRGQSLPPSLRKSLYGSMNNRPVELRRVSFHS